MRFTTTFWVAVALFVAFSACSDNETGQERDTGGSGKIPDAWRQTDGATTGSTTDTTGSGTSGTTGSDTMGTGSGGTPDTMTGGSSTDASRDTGGRDTRVPRDTAQNPTDTPTASDSTANTKDSSSQQNDTGSGKGACCGLNGCMMAESQAKCVGLFFAGKKCDRVVCGGDF